MATYQLAGSSCRGHLLNPGPSNVVEFISTGGFADISIDEVVVSTADDLAQAMPHRTVLDLSAMEQMQLMAFLQELSAESLDHAYYIWAQQQGLVNVDPEGDGERDGLTNFGEWSQDLNPLVSDQDLAQTFGAVFGDDFAMQFRRSRNVPGLHWQAQVSSNLVDWVDQPVLETVLDPDPDADGSAELIERRVLIPDDWPRMFMRYRVE